MDRVIVYPGAIPLDTDILNVSRNVMGALGFLMKAVFGSTTVVDGLSCTPSSPPTLAVRVGPGSVTQFLPFETSPYGSLAADTSFFIPKMGCLTDETAFVMSAPLSVGQSINYLIQAAFLESDTGPEVLP